MPGALFEGSFLLAVVTGYLLLLFGIGCLGKRKFNALCRADGKLTEAARLSGMDNKNFSESMNCHGVTLGPLKSYPST
jgi:hypothetical protein